MSDETKDDLQARLARARQARETRDKADEQRALERECEWLELEERLVKEHGPRGHAFDMINTTEGAIAFRLGEAVLLKRFRDSKQGEVELHDFITPCIVHPAKEAYLEILGRRPGLAIVIANKLCDLYAAKAEDDAGKR